MKPESAPRYAGAARDPSTKFWESSSWRHLLFQVHAHMIRHATGYKLANAGKDTRSIQSYLGHKDIRLTVRYTELSPTRFKNFWSD